MTIEQTQIAQKETSCSLLATFHQPLPALEVLLVLAHHRAGRRGGLGLAGDRRDDLRDVLAHPEALLADPVGLHEVVHAARAGEHQAGQQRRDRDVTRRQRAEVPDVVAKVGPGRHLDGGHDGDRQEDDRQPDLEELRGLERLVDAWRDRQRRADGKQHDDRDRARVPSHQIGERRRPRGAPAGPHVRDHREAAEEDAPRLPGAGEAGDRGLPRRERVALDLHVEEVLDRDADDRQIEVADPGVGADVRPQDVLAGTDAQAGQDHARPEHLAQRQRLRHVAVLHRREVLAVYLRRVDRLFSLAREPALGGLGSRARTDAFSQRPSPPARAPRELRGDLADVSSDARRDGALKLPELERAGFQRTTSLPFIPALSCWPTPQ